MFDEAALRSQKLEPRLSRLLASPECPDLVPCIVQTSDGYNETDERLLATYRCQFKTNLWIIKGYSAELTPKAIEAFLLSDRIMAISYDKAL